MRRQPARPRGTCQKLQRIYIKMMPGWIRFMIRSAGWFFESFLTWFILQQVTTAGPNSMTYVKYFLFTMLCPTAEQRPSPKLTTPTDLMLALSSLPCMCVSHHANSS